MEMVRYIIRPEGSGQVWQNERFSNRLLQSRFAGAVKTVFWVAASVALFAAMSQLQ
ncbi:hypothetical protein SAMN02745704_02132 [Paucidesulfovibrio gracilis DSM 16080]|uniref:Uncharacterized protein n=1 Tax=Paucidesulfovibrio gracilis DSM 16080 TaxID=1121449 RepID=A0A1T4XIR4_9BACT|nr:hypothetical protein [Paucidesulfovibrio gracilis]SKA89397.1 hypothetical protein SAMN02745704_02132 [Paucidesulfovibrio gracilis DSM 16080]